MVSKPRTVIWYLKKTAARQKTHNFNKNYNTLESKFKVKVSLVNSIKCTTTNNNSLVAISQLYHDPPQRQAKLKRRTEFFWTNFELNQINIQLLTRRQRTFYWFMNCNLRIYYDFLWQFSTQTLLPNWSKYSLHNNL